MRFPWVSSVPGLRGLTRHLVPKMLTKNGDEWFTNISLDIQQLDHLNIYHLKVSNEWFPNLSIYIYIIIFRNQSPQKMVPFISNFSETLSKTWGPPKKNHGNPNEIHCAIIDHTSDPREIELTVESP